MSSLGSLLTALAEERGWTRRWDEEKALDAAARLLATILGPRGRPVAVRGGVLLVEVEHPVWGSEILLHKSVLVERINAAVGRGVLADVRVRRAPARRSPSAGAEPRAGKGAPVAGRHADV